MYKNILVAFDGSESSQNALVQAARLAQETGCKIAAVTVTESIGQGLGAFGADELRELYDVPAKKRIVDTKIVELESCPLIESIELEGNVHKAILEVAESRGSDLIVTGRRGLSALERVLMGSVTARVIGYSPIDVLVIPRNTVIDWHNILLATDGSKYSETATRRAVELAKTHHSNLKVISVVDVYYESYEDVPNAPDIINTLVKQADDLVGAIKNQAKELGIKTETFVKEGPAHQHIVDTARDVQAGLIVMGSHGRTGLGRLLMGSVTERVIGHATCPVLVVKTKTT